MALYVWPGSDTATNISQIEVNTRKVGFFTLPYDQIVPTFGATTDEYVSKLGGVTQQTLTITYADGTKAVATNFQVV
jgi:hypothetical protein